MMNLNLMQAGCTTAGCACCVSRRTFLGRCAGSAVLGGTALAATRAWSSTGAARKPKVRVIFHQPKNDRPTWPNIGYDYGVREKQLIDSLTQGAPEVEFLPVSLVDSTPQQAGLIDKDSEVDGYIVCLLGLGWEHGFEEICVTGKPTILVDNLFGGSGFFLTRLPGLMAAGKPLDWVSSSKDEDLVAAARKFALLAQGRSAADVAAAFAAVRRERTPQPTDQSCANDPLQLANLDEALEKLRKTKILVVGGGWGGQPFIDAARNVLGVVLAPIAFEEVAAAYEAANQQEARQFADAWRHGAQAVMETNEDEILKSGAMYVAMKDVMKRHGATGISINCLGGFYNGHLKAYPCLGFSHFNNVGLVGGCEADQMSALTMATIGALAGRPGFISDPVIDTSKNQIIYAHCVAMTRPFGGDGAVSPYRIRSHSEDRQGVAIQSLLPRGYMTTTLEINPVTREVLFHQARSAGNNPSDMACRTKLEGELIGDIEKLAQNWRMGWHRVTFYGDLRDPVAELCERLQLKLVEEA